MKQIKRFAALVLALALLASLLPTLSVSVEAADCLDLTITDGVLSWQPIDNAAKYRINWAIDGWNGGGESVTATSYDLQAAMDAARVCYSG